MEQTVTLANHSFLEGMAPHHAQALKSLAKPVTIRAGQNLYHQGEEACCVYLILNGTVAMQAYAAGRGGATIDTAGPGDYVGWSWLIEPYKAHFDAVAQTDVEAIALDAYELRQMCEQDHQLGYQVVKRILRLMEQRLQGTRLQLLDMYGTSQW